MEHLNSSALRGDILDKRLLQYIIESSMSIQDLLVKDIAVCNGKEIALLILAHNDRKLT